MLPSSRRSSLDGPGGQPAQSLATLRLRLQRVRDDLTVNRFFVQTRTPEQLEQEKGALEAVLAKLALLETAQEACSTMQRFNVKEQEALRAKVEVAKRELLACTREVGAAVFIAKDVVASITDVARQKQSGPEPRPPAIPTDQRRVTAPAPAATTAAGGEQQTSQRAAAMSQLFRSNSMSDNSAPLGGLAFKLKPVALKATTPEQQGAGRRGSQSETGTPKGGNEDARPALKLFSKANTEDQPPKFPVLKPVSGALDQGGSLRRLSVSGPGTPKTGTSQASSPKAGTPKAGIEEAMPVLKPVKSELAAPPPQVPRPAVTLRAAPGKRSQSEGGAPPPVPGGADAEDPALTPVLSTTAPDPVAGDSAKECIKDPVLQALSPVATAASEDKPVNSFAISDELSSPDSQAPESDTDSTFKVNPLFQAKAGPKVTTGATAAAVGLKTIKQAADEPKWPKLQPLKPAGSSLRAAPAKPSLLEASTLKSFRTTAGQATTSSEPAWLKGQALKPTAVPAKVMADSDAASATAVPQGAEVAQPASVPVASKPSTEGEPAAAAKPDGAAAQAAPTPTPAMPVDEAAPRTAVRLPNELAGTDAHVEATKPSSAALTEPHGEAAPAWKPVAAKPGQQGSAPAPPAVGKQGKAPASPPATVKPSYGVLAVSKPGVAAASKPDIKAAAVVSVRDNDLALHDRDRDQDQGRDQDQDSKAPLPAAQVTVKTAPPVAKPVRVIETAPDTSAADEPPAESVMSASAKMEVVSELSVVAAAPPAIDMGSEAAAALDVAAEAVPAVEAAPVAEAGKLGVAADSSPVAAEAAWATNDTTPAHAQQLGGAAADVAPVPGNASDEVAPAPEQPLAGGLCADKTTVSSAGAWSVGAHDFSDEAWAEVQILKPAAAALKGGNLLSSLKVPKVAPAPTEGQNIVVACVTSAVPLSEGMRPVAPAKAMPLEPPAAEPRILLGYCTSEEDLCLTGEASSEAFASSAAAAGAGASSGTLSAEASSFRHEATSPVAQAPRPGPMCEPWLAGTGAEGDALGHITLAQRIGKTSPTNSLQLSSALCTLVLPSDTENEWLCTSDNQPPPMARQSLQQWQHRPALPPLAALAPMLSPTPAAASTTAITPISASIRRSMWRQADAQPMFSGQRRRTAEAGGVPQSPEQDPWRSPARALPQDWRSPARMQLGSMARDPMTMSVAWSPLFQATGPPVQELPAAVSAALPAMQGLGLAGGPYNLAPSSCNNIRVEIDDENFEHDRSAVVQARKGFFRRAVGAVGTMVSVAAVTAVAAVAGAALNQGLDELDKMDKEGAPRQAGRKAGRGRQRPNSDILLGRG